MSESNETAARGGIGDRTTESETGAARTLLHALIGGLVGVLFAFLPYSTLVGGAVAGYLGPGDYVRGATVGTLAGVVALVPVALVALAVASSPVSVTLPFSLAGSVLPLAALAVAYVVGPSLLGGVAGAILRRERIERADVGG